MSCNSYGIPFPLYGRRGLMYTFGDGPPTAVLDADEQGRERVVFSGSWEHGGPRTTGVAYFGCERSDGCLDSHHVADPDPDTLALMALIGACVVLADEGLIELTDGEHFQVERVIPPHILKAIMAHYPDASDYFKDMVRPEVIIDAECVPLQPPTLPQGAR